MKNTEAAEKWIKEHNIAPNSSSYNDILDFAKGLDKETNWNRLKEVILPESVKVGEEWVNMPTKDEVAMIVDYFIEIGVLDDIAKK